MVPQFIDREQELRFLELKYQEDRAQFVIIYGRRRIGKTELIKQFIKGKGAIYHLCTSDGILDNLNRLKEEFSLFTGKNYFKSMNVKLDELLIYLADEVKDQRVILVLDEFQYLVQSDRSVTSLLQRAWDEKLSGTRMFLILTGSSIGMMENEVLSNKSPLYGRRTGSWKVNEIAFPYLFQFFPRYTVEEVIKAWSVLGGVPLYLIQFDVNKSVEDNLKEKILKKGNILYDEPLFLLREEFREQRVYLSVLRAISQGHNSVSLISQFTGIDRSNLSSYLDRLEENGIIERAIPYGKKKGWYEIKDNFIEFWFKFVYNNLDHLEMDQIEDVVRKVNLQEHYAKKFEKLVRESIRQKTLKLPFEYHTVSFYSHKGEEVDVVVEGENAILLGEVKWSENVDVRPLLNKMRKIMSKVNKGKREYYGVFAKSFKRCPHEEDLICYDLDAFAPSSSYLTDRGT